MVFDIDDSNSMAPPMNNQDMCNTFACTQRELDELKSAFKAQLQGYHINGQPFLGQLPSEVDHNGTIREELWENIMSDDPVKRNLLMGYRLMVNTKTFEQLSTSAKEKICRDLTNEARRGRKAGKVGNLAERSRSSSPSSSKTRHGTSRRFARNHRRKNVGRPFPVRLQPADSDDVFDDRSISPRRRFPFAASQRQWPDRAINADGPPPAKRQRNTRYGLRSDSPDYESPESHTRQKSSDSDADPHFTPTNASKEAIGNASQPIDLTTPSSARDRTPVTQQLLACPQISPLDAVQGHSTVASSDSGPTLSMQFTIPQSEAQGAFDLPTKMHDATARFADELHTIAVGLEQQLERRDVALQARSMESVRIMLAERDCEVERLRYMIEGHVRD